MASAQNQKRAFAGDLFQEHGSNKKVKSRGRLQVPSNFPPEFWDKLPKVCLTRRALREFDRRRSAQPALPPGAAPEVSATNLGRFSRRGGPDTRHLRGYPEPKGAVQTMAPSGSAPSRRQTKSSTKAAGVPAKIKPSSAYDANFECHMADNSIFPPLYDFPDNRPAPRPNNFNDDRRVLSTRRRSLSESHFTESAYENSRRRHNTASESTERRNLIPIIAGDADIPNDGDLHFTNIESITGGLTLKAAPDFFDGARLSDVYRKIRDEKEDGNLNNLIIPTTHASAPVVPNFFLEIKAPKGGANVALLQALHDGAIGARAMHALQNCGVGKPTFDGNAYTYSSTYHAGTGTLQLYMHHVTPPAPGGRPQYHMTQLRGLP